MSDSQSHLRITTHILDIATGFPASEVLVRLERRMGDEWLSLAVLPTNDDGRVELYDAQQSQSELLGEYRLIFEVNSYFIRTGQSSFYPVVQVAFIVRDIRHYHVPLLLGPFGYSTYRGS